MTGNPLTREALERMLLRPPLHRFLGLELVDFGDGVVRIRMPFREELVGEPDGPRLHGGILATLLDTAADYAVATRLGRTLPTIDLRVDYLRTAGREPLDAVGTVVKIGRTVALADARVENAAGSVLALGRVVFSAVSVSARPHPP